MTIAVTAVVFGQGRQRLDNDRWAKSVERTPSFRYVKANDLTARKNALVALGVSPEKRFIGKGLTRADWAPRGLKEALAA